MDQFPSNSKTTKQGEEKSLEKVVEGPVVERPKSLGRKFKDTFLNGGDFKGIAQYVTFNVILPETRKLMYDVVVQGFGRMIFGDERPRTQRGSSPFGGTHVSYDNAYGNTRWRDRSTMLPGQPPHRARVAQRSLDDVVVSTRSDAERVVERLLDIIDKYDVVSVADLRQLLGLPSSHVDNRWGWTALNSVEIRQIRDGYLIDLPPEEPI